MSEFTHYKLVRVGRGQRRSLYTRGIASVEYRPRRWARPHPRALSLGYGLCVYDDWEEAWCWAAAANSTARPVELWACEVGRTWAPAVPILGVVTTLAALAKPDAASTGTRWPRPALMTDRVRLIRRMRYGQ